MLVQNDTNQATSLSQPLLNIVELSPNDGAILGDQVADVPGVDAAYSSWVDPGQAVFHEDHGKIKVTGQYFLVNDPKNRRPFRTTLPARTANYMPVFACTARDNSHKRVPFPDERTRA